MIKKPSYLGLWIMGGLIILIIIITIILSLQKKINKTTPTPPTFTPITPTQITIPPTFTPITPPLLINNVIKGKEFLNLISIYPNSVDPTGGFVDYYKYTNIENNPLIGYDNEYVYIGVATAIYPKTAQNIKIKPNTSIPSVRLYTQKTIYNGGLFSIELFNIPSGEGVWPAIWFSQDPHQLLPNSQAGNWPINGEIDWIENVNSAEFNQSTLHIDGWTSQGLCPWNCQYKPQNFCNGKGCVCPKNCKGECGSEQCPWICKPKIQAPFGFGYNSNEYCSSFGANYGCAVKAPNGSFGNSFNQNNSGSVFSMDWIPLDDDGYNFIIKFWFITDQNIINNSEYGPFSNTPDTSRWNEPYGIYDNSNQKSKCKIQNLQLIINITLCGAWAGSLIQNCEKIIFNQNALKDAYFKIGRFAYLTPTPIITQTPILDMNTFPKDLKGCIP